MPTHNIGACACCGAPTPVCDPVSLRFLSLTYELSGTWSNVPGRYEYRDGQRVYIPAGKMYRYYGVSLDFVLEITHSDNNVELITAQDVRDRADCQMSETLYNGNTQDGTVPTDDFCLKMCNKYLGARIHLPPLPSDAPNPFTITATLENSTVDYDVQVICAI